MRLAIYLFLVFTILGIQNKVFASDKIKSASNRSYLIDDYLLVKERIRETSDGTKIELSGFVAEDEEGNIYDSKIWTIRDECNKSVEFIDRPLAPITIQTLCDYNGDGTFYKNAYSLLTGAKLLSYDVPSGPEPLQLRLLNRQGEGASSRIIGFLNASGFKDDERLIRPIQDRDYDGNVFGVLYYSNTRGVINELFLIYDPDKFDTREYEDEIQDFVVTSIEIVPPGRQANITEDNNIYTRTISSLDSNNQFSGFVVVLTLSTGDGTDEDDSSLGTIIIPITKDKFNEGQIVDRTTLDGKITSISRLHNRR